MNSSHKIMATLLACSVFYGFKGYQQQQQQRIQDDSDDFETFGDREELPGMKSLIDSSSPKTAPPQVVHLM